MKNKIKKEYDQNGNLVWYENNKGGWDQREYDPETNELIFWENQDGVIYSLNEARLKKKFRTKTNFVIELAIEQILLPTEEYEDVYTETYDVLTTHEYTEIHDIVRSYVEQGAYWDFQTVDFEIDLPEGEEGEYYRVWLEVYKLDLSIGEYIDEPQNIGIFGCIKDAKAWINYLVNVIFKQYEGIDVSTRGDLQEAKLKKQFIKKYSFEGLRDALSDLDGSTNPNEVSNLMNYEFRIMNRKFIRVEYGKGYSGDYMIYEDTQEPNLWFEITFQPITSQHGIVTKPFEFKNLKLSDELEEIIISSVMGEESEIDEGETVNSTINKLSDVFYDVMRKKENATMNALNNKK